ncbi:hypothetical protein D4R99_03585 [bacterium]|nr:MAG: hypothetical protein D4R99_03585 [bacterium]
MVWLFEKKEVIKMKISKICEKTEHRILIICLIIITLFGLSFAGLGSISVFSLWLLVRWLPICFLFIFFFETCKLLSKAIFHSETKKEKYRSFAFGVFGIFMCSGLVWVIFLPF